MMRHGAVASRRDGSVCILAALVAALCIGFLIPRPQFIETVMSDSPDREMDTSDASAKGGFKTSLDSHDGDTLEKKKLVQVDFYGESLCPDCQHMVLDILAPMFDNGIADFMNLTYIAYGNVKENVQDDGKIQCQHGPVECRFNRYINCAQNEKHNQKDWFPLVHCLATHMNEIESRAPDCAEDAGFSSNKLFSCADGSLGARLEREAGDATTSLHPKHTFVPWIVVNGTPLGGDFENLDRVICSHIPHKERPEACLELPRGLQQMKRGK